jgi:hypothetical protein
MEETQLSRSTLFAGFVFTVVISCVMQSSVSQVENSVSGTVRDSCFSVRGRLAIGNGTPSCRIWIVGTKRILGIEEKSTPQDEESPMMPDTLRNLVGFDRYVFGDFTVYPVTKALPGRMQIVRVTKASNLRVVLR